MPKFNGKEMVFYEEEAIYDPTKVVRLLINGTEVDVLKGSYTERKINFETPVKDAWGRDTDRTVGTNIEIFRFIDRISGQSVVGKTEFLNAMWLDDLTDEE